ncbi:MAG: hypothetical protein HIU88_04505 [Acidobacteria bacterium]|nr:hypothetical protein [Acidobacteriota bacterium]
MTPPRTASRTRLLAVTLTVVAAMALSGCSMLAQLGTGRNASGTPTAVNSKADVFSLKVGDCLNDAAATGTVTTAPIVPCNMPHDSEAYFAITMTGTAFPGDQAVKDQASQGCATAFPAFIGISYNDSSLSISYYFPTAESWANGDRQILCTVYDPGAKSTGTLKNAKR